MPTTTVTTWQQLLDAYVMQQGTSEDPHIIEIMADLNGNDAPMTAGISSGTGTNGYYKIINGNYHNINNISTGAVVNAVLFQGRYVTWNKCNFTNMFRNEQYAFFGGSYTNYNQYFNDCTFQGKGYRIADAGTFTRCVIGSWESSRTYGSSGGIFGTSDFITCYINANFKRDAGQNFDYHSLINCFVKGKIEPATPSVTSGWHIVGAVRNSCLNIETSLNYSTGISGSTAQSIINAYNTDKMTGTIGAKSDMIGVTDAQMRDAAYLASIGLNIIV